MDRDGMNPTRDVSTYAWLTERGWSGIVCALRKKHDLTPREFFVGVVGLGDDKTDEDYDWGVDDDRTVEVSGPYLGMLESWRGLTDSTPPTHHIRLTWFAQIYRNRYGSADLLSRFDDRDAEPDEIDRCFAILDGLDVELATDGTKPKYPQTVRSFYEYLADFRRAWYSPVENAIKQLCWGQGQPDNRMMTADQMSDVYAVADDFEDRLLVLGLAGWGLRPNGLAPPRASQFILSGDGPHIAFDERKSGSGTVALFYGVDAAAARIDVFVADDGWNDALPLSPRAASGRIARETVNRRSKRLADKVDVTADDEVPTTKLCRRSWYTTYQGAVDEMLAQLEGVAAGQGSKSVDIITSNYLSEEHRRLFRRQVVREMLVDVFESAGESATVETQMPRSSRWSLRETRDGSAAG